MQLAPVLIGSLVAACLLAPTPGSAAGGGGGGGGGFSTQSTPASDPGRKARRAYDRARRDIEKAAEHREKAAAASDPDDRAEHVEEAREDLERAVERLREAVGAAPDFHEAHSDLGFALRSLGRYREALAAYDEALSLEPDYAPAIEYRGEAYLELGDLDAAARAHRTLSRQAPELADMLLGKMRDWVARKRTDPGDMDPGTIESFGRWVERRSARLESGAARASAW